MELAIIQSVYESEYHISKKNGSWYIERRYMVKYRPATNQGV